MYCFRLAKRCNLLYRENMHRSGQAALTRSISSSSARAPGDRWAPRRVVTPMWRVQSRHLERQHDQLGGAHFMVQLARRQHGQHVAVQQQAAQQGQVAGLDGRHRRFHALAAEKLSIDSRSGVPARPSTQG
jgi:hypothetical protein